MSKLGKIFLWVALVGALTAVGAGIALILKYNDTKENLAQTQQAKAADEKTIVKDKAEYTALTAAKAESDKQLADAQTQVTDLNTKLTDAKKEAADSATALATASDALKAAEGKLDAIKQALGDETPDQYKADKAKAESDLAAAQSEKKILEDQLQGAHTQPPGISGKVTFVDRTWNFVVLDVGLSNGVVPNGELIVYRGRNFLGKVRVTKADPNDAVAEILPDIKGDIQVGDSVLN
jgi:hypothetical protein